MPESVSLPVPQEAPHRGWLRRHWTRFADARFDQLPPDLQGAYATALRDGRGLYLWGDTGVGKSWALVALFDHVGMVEWKATGGVPNVTVNEDGSVSQPPYPALWGWLDMLDDIRHDYDRGAPLAYTYFLAADPLFLDDVGSGRPTAWAAERLFRLVEERGRLRRLTYLTGNHPLPELEGLLNRAYGSNGDLVSVGDGQRIASRLTEQCVGYHMTGPDRRLG